MKTLPPSTPTYALNGNGHAPAPRSTETPFGPVVADMEQAERVFYATLAQYRSPFGPLVQHLRHYRGKRLRPALLLLAARACGQVAPAHHTLAAVVEMIHTATLVHDDVLDEAETRRHVQTVNAGWGNKVSILLGDMLFTHAFHLTSTVDVRACNLIGDATNRVCAGELKQVVERGNLHLTEADYFAIVDGKTAALTEVCGRLGALYAGATEEVADALAAYGRNLGIAFQVADDLLDLTGDESKAGKTLGTDLEQQKLTLPIIYALNKLPSAAADALRGTLGSADPARRTKVAATLDEVGAVGYARRRAEEFARTAKVALACLPESECRAILEQMTNWAIRREK
ncbi:polyprenyl synthetase family protein [Fimbriiglobus ruber]|uniref:Octaprenyl diphosphate synthase n=1 Tax=Fimbriiglobus ruber TaxID=1908690 RepID=A0A225DEN0_9BACT|nr:polyprenyl synthetase family protein [Fimbriiglobus ruber]OWK36978.1 Octaprenyl diphosphate synthase [Fimbriiglobus ruber]